MINESHIGEYDNYVLYRPGAMSNEEMLDRQKTAKARRRAKIEEIRARRNRTDNNK